MKTRLQPRDDKRAGCAYQTGWLQLSSLKNYCRFSSLVAAAQWSSHGTRLGTCPTGLTTVGGVGSMENMCV